MKVIASVIAVSVAITSTACSQDRSKARKMEMLDQEFGLVDCERKEVKAKKGELKGRWLTLEQAKNAMVKEGMTLEQATIGVSMIGETMRETCDPPVED